MPTGKCIKAMREIIRQQEDSDDIRARLKVVHDTLTEIAGEKEILFDQGTAEKAAIQTENLNKNNRICDLDCLPSRIEFKLNGLRFYIDFVVLSSSSGESLDFVGGIVYGAQRAQCFTTCAADGIRNSAPHGHSVGLARCDGLEDKPLLKLSIDDHGRITESDRIYDEWWIGKRNKPKEAPEWIVDQKSNEDLQEMHYRVMKEIWRDALNWGTERLLP